MSEQTLRDEAMQVAAKLADKAFDGRAGHGGTQSSYRQMRRDELIAYLAAAFELGVERGTAKLREIPKVMDRKVTVCGACETAACWQGSFFCDYAEMSGTKEFTVRELHQTPRGENAEYWFKNPNDGKVDQGLLEEFRAAIAQSTPPSERTTMEENKAKTALTLLDRELTRESLRELTDDELSKLRGLLWHWHDLADSERQRRRAQSR